MVINLLLRTFIKRSMTCFWYLIVYENRGLKHLSLGKPSQLSVFLVVPRVETQTNELSLLWRINSTDFFCEQHKSLEIKSTFKKRSCKNRSCTRTEWCHVFCEPDEVFKTISIIAESPCTTIDSWKPADGGIQGRGGTHKAIIRLRPHLRQIRLGRNCSSAIFPPNSATTLSLFPLHFARRIIKMDVIRGSDVKVDVLDVVKVDVPFVPFRQKTTPVGLGNQERNFSPVNR